MLGNEDYFIRKIRIDGLFNGASSIDIEMSEAINCIYGANGSGKTTIINLLVAALSCDLKRIANVKFRTLTVFISKAQKKRPTKFFTLQKKVGANGICEQLQYLFSEGQEFVINGPVEGIIPSDVSKIKLLIDSKISVNYLPLNRVNETDINESFREREMMMRNFRTLRDAESEDFELLFDPIRRMLISLERRFKDDFSKRQRAVRTDLEVLKDKVLEKLLIDDDLVKKVKETSLQKGKVTKEDYKAAKQKLDDIGLKLPNDKLEKHFTLMVEVSENLVQKQMAYMAFTKSSQPQTPNYTENYTAAASEYSNALRIYRSLNPFHNRLMSIISDVEKSTEYRLEQLKLFRNFQDSINRFLVNKRFEFTESGGFSFSCEGMPIKIEELSSGEKHIVALLGKVALAPAAGSIFIADEPELSLHLSWQRKLLLAIQDLSPDMQIIVATHAPAIIPSTANKIDLDDLSNDDASI